MRLNSPTHERKKAQTDAEIINNYCSVEARERSGHIFLIS